MTDRKPVSGDEPDAMDKVSKYIFIGGGIICLGLGIWALFLAP